MIEEIMMIVATADISQSAAVMIIQEIIKRVGD